MPMSIRADSTEYVTATVTVDHDITTITGSQLQVAVPVKNAAPDTWYDTTIVGVVEATADKWTATYRLLVGPAAGAFSLAAGSYDWTVRITDTPEVPIRKVTTITVTET